MIDAEVLRVRPASGGAAGFSAYCADLSRSFLDLGAPVDPSSVRDLVVAKANALGLDEDVDAHLLTGLRQTGCLGPDESVEYHAGLLALFAAVGVTDPRRPRFAELFEVFRLAGHATATTLTAVLPPTPGRTPVFLGTDAEFLKLTYDLLAGRQDASAAHYVSRLALLSRDERAALPTAARAVFGPGETSTTTTAGRHHSWMDNGLVPSQIWRLVTGTLAGRTGDLPFPPVFLAAFDRELREGHDQATRVRDGRLTQFGTPHPAVDDVVRQGIADGLFTRRCHELGHRFLDATRGLAGTVTICDIGAIGTQPWLLYGATKSLRPSADLAVCVFTPRPDRWAPPSPHLLAGHATARFAFAVETTKTYFTNYQDAATREPVTLADPPQQLVAFLKQLAFHRAVTEFRTVMGAATR